MDIEAINAVAAEYGFAPYATLDTTQCYHRQGLALLHVTPFTHDGAQWVSVYVNPDTVRGLDAVAAIRELMAVRGIERVGGAA
jgi:hypothetical protein